MSEMTLLDKAAEAVRVSSSPQSEFNVASLIPWADLDRDQREAWRSVALSVARAILSAPASEGMRNASVDAELRDDWSTAGLWSAMSSALLSELSGSAEREAGDMGSMIWAEHLPRESEGPRCRHKGGAR